MRALIWSHLQDSSDHPRIGLSIGIQLLSVAWPQQTVKGLIPPGISEDRDPYTDSGKRRPRV